VTPTGHDPGVQNRPEDAQRRAVPRPAVGTAEWSTARKLLASVGLVTAWAALTGLATFGTFTDPTTPIDGPVDSSRVGLGLGATDSWGESGGQRSAVDLTFTGVQRGVAAS
jgi:hypothetical protein